MTVGGRKDGRRTRENERLSGRTRGTTHGEPRAVAYVLSPDLEVGNITMTGDLLRTADAPTPSEVTQYLVLT